LKSYEKIASILSEHVVRNELIPALVGRPVSNVEKKTDSSRAQACHARSVKWIINIPKPSNAE